MRNLRVVVTVISLLLVGCIEHEDNISPPKKEEILTRTKVVDFMLTNWDYDEHFLVAVDSIWVEKDLLKKKGNTQLLLSDRYYFSDKDFKEVVKFILEHSLTQIDKKGLENNQKVVVVRLYGDSSEELLNVIVQYPYSENYFREFKRYLSTHDGKSEFGLIIQNLNKYDSLLRR